VRPKTHRHDQDLISLARETRRAADSMPDAALHERLIEIADELLDLAGAREKAGHESRGYGWPA
jgi:hypothetical protein